MEAAFMNEFEHVFEHETLDLVKTGQALRKIRKERKIAVPAVARHLGITGQSVYNWEIGGQIKLEHLVPLCRLYKVSLDNVVKLKTEKAVYCDYDE